MVRVGSFLFLPCPRQQAGVYSGEAEAEAVLLGQDMIYIVVVMKQSISSNNICRGHAVCVEYVW